jgi:hypothetical protein
MEMLLISSIVSRGKGTRMATKRKHPSLHFVYQENALCLYIYIIIIIIIITIINVRIG